jgi:hypothetical protein
MEVKTRFISYMVLRIKDLRADNCESLQQSYLSGRYERMGPSNWCWRLEVEAESGFEDGGGGVLHFNNHDVIWYLQTTNYRVITE